MNFSPDISGHLKWAGAAALFLTLSACDTGPELAKYNLAPSSWAVERGYPELLPVSFFDTSKIIPRESGNLIGRAAALRARMAVLRGPVLSTADRARLEAAVARHKPL